MKLGVWICPCLLSALLSNLVIGESNLGLHSLGSPPVLSMCTLWHFLHFRRWFRGEIEPVGVYKTNSLTYKNCNTTEEDRAALHQRHYMETRSTVHVAMLSSPHSPIFRGHCSQCSAWAHWDSALPTTAFPSEVSLPGFWNNPACLQEDFGKHWPRSLSPAARTAAVQEHWALLWAQWFCSTCQAREQSFPLLHHNVWAIRYFFSFLFSTPCPATCEIAKTFFIYEEN